MSRPKIVALHEPQADVIALLEGLLEQARAGRVRAVAACAQHATRDTGTTFAMGDGDVAHLIAACQRLNLRLLEHEGDNV